MRNLPLTLGDIRNCLETYQRHLRIERDYQESIRRRSNQLASKLQDNESKKVKFLMGFDSATERQFKAETKREQELLRNDLTLFLQSPPPEAISVFKREGAYLQRALPRTASSLRVPPWWAAASPHLYERLGTAGGPIHFQLTPPALATEPASPFTSAELGELNLYAKSSGLGGSWGLGAVATQAPVYGALSFAFLPPFSGDLYVESNISLSGTVYVAGHDHWYTSTDALLKITIGCRLFQSYVDAGPPMVIINEHHWNTSAAYWVIDRFHPTASTTVVSDMPIIIDVWVSIEAWGHSDHALVEADFRNGADKFIRVPSVDVTLVPF